MNCKIVRMCVAGLVLGCVCGNIVRAGETNSKAAPVPALPIEVIRFERVCEEDFRNILNSFILRATTPLRTIGVPLAQSANAEFKEYLQMVVLQSDTAIKERDYERCLLYGDKEWFLRNMGYQQEYDPCTVLQILLADAIGTYVRPLRQMIEAANETQQAAAGENAYRVLCMVQTYETKRFAHQLLMLWDQLQAAIKATQGKNAAQQQAKIRQQNRAVPGRA